MTPFYASTHEAVVSEEQAAYFHLYWVFKFRDQPKVFVLSGSLRQNCILDAVQYRVTLA
jgi:hypothetical protein